MTLPKIERPLFEVELPTMGTKIKMRPYLVKEEKILLLAQESKDVEQIILATKQLISNCIVEKDSQFNVDDLPNFILEWLLIQLRIRSVGEIVNLSYRDIDDGTIYNFEVDLRNIKMFTDESHTDAIELTPEIGLLMKYPGINLIRYLDLEKSPTDFSFDVIRLCINKVFTENEVIEFHDHSEEEQIEFLEQFSREDLQKIVEFFDTMPKVGYDLEYVNSNGDERIIELRGLDDFFI